AKCMFLATEGEPTLVRPRFLRSPISLKLQEVTHRLCIRPGALASAFVVEGENGVTGLRLNFSRSYNGKLDRLAENFGARLDKGQWEAALRGVKDFLKGGLLQLGKGISQ